MSIPVKTTCTCPNCGKQHEITIFSSINTDSAPDIIEKVISGEFFIDTCPDCGNSSLLEYDVLFNDMKHNAMIWVLHPNNEKYEETAAGIRENDTGLIKYTRIVHSMRELAEKVTCLEYGIDDRYLEIYKAFTVAVLVREKPEFKVAYAYFMAKSREDKYVAIIGTDGATVTYEFNEKIYEKQKQEFEPLVESINSLPYPEINAFWATEVIKIWTRELKQEQ